MSCRPPLKFAYSKFRSGSASGHIFLLVVAFTAIRSSRLLRDDCVCRVYRETITISIARRLLHLLRDGHCFYRRTHSAFTAGRSCLPRSLRDDYFNSRLFTINSNQGLRRVTFFLCWSLPASGYRRECIMLNCSRMDRVGRV